MAAFLVLRIFVIEHLQSYIKKVNIYDMDFIKPRSPLENGFIESFNGKPQD